ncbi:MAG: pilus assembly protein [Sphingomonadales bacterium]|nr:pilus assembly protein [Sphingomonadales bacterium]MDE2570060.1 pilus assembly protein [Sphingomonadales bacterium]
MRIFPRLGPAREGTALIELAIIMPVLTMIVLGLTDVVRAYMLKVHIEQVARTGGEYAAGSKDRIPDPAEIQAQLATDSGLPASDITVTRWLECDGVSQGDVQYCATSSQQPAQYISIDVQDRFQPVFGLINWGQGANSQLVTGHQTVRVR